MVKNIILDTDIGGDPDDLFALLMALNSRELYLRLILTTDEYKQGRFKYTQKLLNLLDKNINVVSGKDFRRKKCFVVGHLIKDIKEKSKKDLTNEMQKIIQKNDHTYVVCLGPLSNIAEYLLRYPRMKDKISLIVMGGFIKGYGKLNIEHNILYDIPSAQKVLSSGINCRWVLGDHTYKDEISIIKQSEVVRKIKYSNKPYSNLIYQSLMAFFNNLFPKSFMHDPLTLSFLIDKSIITFKKERIIITDRGLFKKSKEGYATNISNKVNYQRFNRMFKERVTNYFF